MHWFAVYGSICSALSGVTLGLGWADTADVAMDTPASVIAAITAVRFQTRIVDPFPVDVIHDGTGPTLRQVLSFGANIWSSSSAARIQMRGIQSLRG